MSGSSNKRRCPLPAAAASPSKRPNPSAPSPNQSPTPLDEDMMDEDVILSKTLYEEEDVLLLRDETFSSRLSKWKRPPLPADLQSLVFQQLEIDYVVGETNKQLLPSSSGPAAILRIFGVTLEGYSVCCQVHGFEPYFYVYCPPGMGPDDISRFHQTLEGRMRESNKSSNVPRFVKRIELVQKKSVMYYQQHLSQAFLRIVVALPTMVASCRGILERGIQIEGIGSKNFLTYESNILFALRFMIDCNIVGGNWIEVPAGKYKKANRNMSSCQVGVDCLYSDLISHVLEGEYSKMAPFLILSFDIECAGRKGLFPEPTHDPVIQIANLVTLQGDDKPLVRNVMTLKSCSPIVGVDVMSFDTEKDVFLAWRDFVREIDPDIIIGYNICKFDLPYLIERAEILKIAEFPMLGRIKNSRVRVRDTNFSSSSVYVYVDAGPQSDNAALHNLVLEAKAGYYQNPIATLDFASLYPSIMMAYNLCYCTLVTPESARQLNLTAESVNKTPSGDIFVKSGLQKGILPEILEELLAARKRAKADLKKAKDPFEKSVLDGRQLALKISANSVYGFTGATVGQLPCLEISSSVTSYGRQMIEQTKKLVEEKFTKVIYGDTDSVMVQFGVPRVKDAMKLGKEAAQYITGTFRKPINLEFEKVYYPYLLISKKRYAGLYWSNSEKYDKMDTKGIETVRRDNCLLVKILVTECLNKLLIDRDIDGAKQYVKKTITDLLKNKMDLSLLVITKGLLKNGDDYAVKAAHVELAERMRKRDAATAPNVGDRVPYVIIKAAKGAKAYEKSEDPIFVLENNIPIDTQYYLENQISKPLLRIFEPILGERSKELFHGSHTSSISISTPSNSGIMKFAKKQLVCLGCKTLIGNTGQTLCSYCKGREAEIYCKTVDNVSELEMLFGRLWTQCQECQGSLHQDVLCTSRDCPTFYRRKKAQKDMAEAKMQLERWDF